MGQPVTQRRVLIVDDNEDAAVMVAALIEAYGHVTQIAFSGRSALLTASKFAPDVIVMDINMPGMDGFEAIALLRTGTTEPCFPSSH